jgi:hypothetical protein
MPQTELQRKSAEAPETSDLNEAAQIRYLTPRDTVFRLTEGRMLSVEVAGELYPVVYLHCSFPHTNRRIFISVRTDDNKEVGIISNLDDFPEPVAKLLEEQMQIRYYAPFIKKVLNIREEFGYSFWEAETTAGLCRFTVRKGGGNLKMVTEHKLLITDVDGNRFIIERLDRLSEKEYRMVEICM